MLGSEVAPAKLYAIPLTVVEVCFVAVVAVVEPLPNATAPFKVDCAFVPIATASSALAFVFLPIAKAPFAEAVVLSADISLSCAPIANPPFDA